LRLAALTNDRSYETRAQETLETFAGVVEHFGLYAASYALALRRAIEPPLQVCVVGADDAAEQLAATAAKTFLVNKSVIRLRPEQLAELPPGLAETLPGLSKVAESFALVCRANVCLPPIFRPEELSGALV
jgi:hypothetical protein